MMNTYTTDLGTAIAARLQAVRPLNLTESGIEQWKQNRYSEVAQLIAADRNDGDSLGHHRAAVVIVDAHASTFDLAQAASEADEIAVMGWADKHYGHVTDAAYCCLEGEPRPSALSASPSFMGLDSLIGNETAWPMYSNLMHRGWEVVGSYQKQPDGSWVPVFDKWVVEIQDGEVITNTAAVDNSVIQEAMRMQHNYTDLMLITDNFCRINFGPFHWQVLSTAPDLPVRMFLTAQV